MDRLTMAAHRASQAGGFVREDAPLAGYLTPMLTVPAAGGLVTLADTQLITARVNEPVQWVVTMAQVHRPSQPQGAWLQDFDGTAYTNAAHFGAPVVPQAPGVALSMLQVNVRWGVGAVRFATSFDYPLAGGAFGITADTLDVDVKLRSNAAQTPIDPATIPVIGAMMVPGQATDIAPLRWQEVGVSLNLAAGATWSVKPFSRKLHIVSALTTKATLVWEIVTGVANNLQVISQQTLVEAIAGQGIDTVIDVPAQAEAVGITNLAGAQSTFYLDWRIGLV